jgi:hypothetical protein
MREQRIGWVSGNAHVNAVGDLPAVEHAVLWVPYIEKLCQKTAMQQPGA